MYLRSKNGSIIVNFPTAGLNGMQINIGQNVAPPCLLFNRLCVASLRVKAACMLCAPGTKAEVCNQAILEVGRRWSSYAVATLDHVDLARNSDLSKP